MTAICYFRSSNSCSLELLTSVHWFTGPPRSQGSVRSEVWHLCLAPAAFSIFSAVSCNTGWKLEKNIVLVYNGIRERESRRVAEFVATLLPHSPSRAEHLFLCCERINKLLMWFTVWDHWSIFVVERPWELGCEDQEQKKNPFFWAADLPSVSSASSSLFPSLYDLCCLILFVFAIRGKSILIYIKWW